MPVRMGLYGMKPRIAWQGDGACGTEHVLLFNEVLWGAF